MFKHKPFHILSRVAKDHRNYRFIRDLRIIDTMDASQGFITMKFLGPEK
jgi:hypothetical protein